MSGRKPADKSPGSDSFTDILRPRGRSTSSLYLGVLTGIIIGMLIITAPKGPFGLGTAISTKNAYYYVNISQVSEWLSEKVSSEETKILLSSALSKIRTLSTAQDLPQAYLDTEIEIDQILTTVYSLLLGEEVTETDLTTLTTSAEVNTPLLEEKFTVCLALDDDPYNLPEPQIVLYLSVPDDQSDWVNIPENWEELGGPKSLDLFWVLLRCYSED